LPGQHDPDVPPMPSVARSGSSAPSGLRRLLRDYGLQPRKSLGQHFLVDRGALQRIVRAADLVSTDTVIEVGPGPGILTRELLARAGRVIAVEKDERMADMLARELADPRLTVVTGDMLEVAPEALLDLEVRSPLPFREGGQGVGSYKVVANLPYYVAAPILRQFLEARLRPKLMVVLLQKEVAERAAARPGDMSLLSLGVQLYARPTVVGIVKAGSFYPPPKVDSAIVRLDVLEQPAADVAPELFFKVAAAGFSAKRKQVANSLAHGLGIERDEAVKALREAGIEPQRRAETLSIPEWAALCRALQPKGRAMEAVVGR